MSNIEASQRPARAARLREDRAAAGNQPVRLRSGDDATKADVKAAVEALFNVKVEAVNVLNVKGKSKAFRFRAGTRGDWRKAYVRLAEGQSIDVMAKA